MHIEFSDFEKIRIHTGTIIEASVLEKARIPAFKLLIDLGNMGIKRSSAQITHHYTTEELVGMQVICVTNFLPKNIAGWESEVLVTGFPDPDNHVILAVPDKKVPNGAKLY